MPDGLVMTTTTTRFQLIPLLLLYCYCVPTGHCHSSITRRPMNTHLTQADWMTAQRRLLIMNLHWLLVMLLPTVYRFTSGSLWFICVMLCLCTIPLAVSCIVLIISSLTNLGSHGTESAEGTFSWIFFQCFNTVGYV